jgi:hypothetical protein
MIGAIGALWATARADWRVWAAVAGAVALGVLLALIRRDARQAGALTERAASAARAARVSQEMRDANAMAHDSGRDVPEWLRDDRRDF